MRVLVTGGAGYIGSVAATMLIAKGFQVNILDDLSTGHLENIPSNAKFIDGSILDVEKVLKALENCDGVLHFAGKSIVGESVYKPELYRLINVEGTKNLLRCMRDKNVRKIVFSSSAATYGEVEMMPIKENTNSSPTNPYGETKLEAEALLNQECVDHGLSAVSLRYFNVAGAYKSSKGWLVERHEPETHLIPNVLKSSVQNPVNIFGTDWPTKDGTCVRDYVHVVDLVDAHLKALFMFGVPGHKIYNLGSGTGYSVREVIEAAGKATGRSIPFLETSRRSGDPASLLADISNAYKELGWIPQLDINDIVRDAWLSFESEVAW